jgi:hypothetical protein
MSVKDLAQFIGAIPSLGVSELVKENRSSGTGSFSSKSNVNSAKQIAYDTKRAYAMIDNLNKSTKQAIELMDNMVNGVGNLDDIWKGETKETFVEQLKELDNLIKENVKTIEELTKKIKQETDTRTETENRQTLESEVLYEATAGRAG